MTQENLPQHVAIIMDGNGRWAQARGLPRTAGHRQGIERVKEIIEAAAKSGIKVLTLFAFSTENWARPKKEIDMLMEYLGRFLQRQVKELDKNNIRLKVIGRDEPLPKHIQAKIREAEKSTQDNTGLILVLALNYGARQEIVDAAKRLIQPVLKGERNIEDLSEEVFASFLSTAGLPDPDLLIRTSGEMRLSNFLLWQLSYAELVFPKKYWPDFKSQDFQRAVKNYMRKQRRFGKVVVS